MKTVPFIVAGVVLGSATALTATTVNAKVRVVPYSKVGNWNVRAVYSSKGLFDHCSANARYKSGTRISIIVYRSGNWRLWFAHKNWPDRGRTTFPAKVQVDDRIVLSQKGHYKGRNAYVDLGRNIARVKALMRGRSMAIVTPAGTSRFSLLGTNRATRQIAGCWKANYQRRTPSGGAFGSAQSNSGGGAFGGRKTTTRRRLSNELSRANTLEIATRYLSKASQAYSILPKEKALLKYFPVNWRYQNGAIGGMRVFKNTKVGVSKLLGTLLSDQAKHCKGRNASERKPQKQLRGRNIARATGICQASSGSVLKTGYTVAEIGRGMVMMVMEVRSASGGGSNKAKRRNGGDNIVLPGPNEL